MRGACQTHVMGTQQPSFCRICLHGCSIRVAVEDGRAVDVTGDPESSLYQGFSCSKGRAQATFLRHPRRLLTSLKRSATGGFEPIGAEQAMDEIAARLTELVGEHGPRTLASYWGTMAAASSMTGALLSAFMTGLQSPMQFSPNTIDKPGKALAKALHGSWMAPAQGFDQPDVALLLGVNPLISFQGMPFGNPGKWLSRALRDGMALIVIDPRDSDVAKRATLHLKARPGTDAMILAAIIRVIIEEGLYDRAFVAEHVEGLGLLRDHVARFRPEVVASIADVEAADILAAARLFATAQRGYAMAGTGPSMSGPGTLVEYLVLDLLSLCGRWLRAGELVRNSGSLIPPLQPRAQVSPPRAAAGFGERLRVRNLTDTVAGMPVSALAEEILRDGPGKVRALISCGGNPVAAWPDQHLTSEAMRSLDLLVQIDPWMSQTAALAHYVIAPTMPLEVPDVTLLHDTLLAPHLGPVENWAQYTPAIVQEPPGSDLLQEWEFFFGLARAPGAPAPDRSPTPVADCAHQPGSRTQAGLG